MKTSKDYTICGIFIPKGTTVEDTDTCAVIARYDESAGMKFEKIQKFMKPKHGLPIALPREILEN